LEPELYQDGTVVKGVCIIRDVMGYYTEFKFKAKLKKDTPELVVDLLKRVLVEKDLGTKSELFHSIDVFKPIISHPFFQCERWYMCLLANNFDPNIQGGKFYKKGDYWTIEIHSEFKNYDQEIDNFFNWIKPFIVGRKKKQYVGCYKGEDTNEYTNIYVER